jgi:2-polyprenyl-6-methoxyphenol hydroxylase-like FAD-dependent oxidoreductase
VGARVQVYDRLTAVVGRFKPAAGSAAPPLIEAMPEGWWYSARVPSGALIAVLVQALARADAPLAGSWAAMLAAAPCTRGRLSGGRPIGPLTTHEVSVQTVVGAPGVRCVSVGDAALGLDPLAGSGLRVGLETAIEAAEVVVALLDGNDEPATAYAAVLRQRFARHIAERAYYYSLEHRWPASPFWAARRAGRDHRGSPSGGHRHGEPVTAGLDVCLAGRAAGARSAPV